MHIEKAVDVVDLVQAPELLSITQDDVALLEDCKYFAVHRLRVANKATVKIDRTSFHSLIVTEGSGIIHMNDTQTEFNNPTRKERHHKEIVRDMLGACSNKLDECPDRTGLRLAVPSKKRQSRILCKVC